MFGMHLLSRLFGSELPAAQSGRGSSPEECEAVLRRRPAVRLILTDELIRRLPRSVNRWDTYYDVRKGLTLRVYPSGRKTWIMRFKVDGREVDRKIGTFPQMSPFEARCELRRRPA